MSTRASGSPPRIHAITLGCQMSASDGADTVASLLRRGWGRTEEIEDADAILMTTCSVRRHAEQRAMSLIGRLREWKSRDPNRVLVVAGCVAERLGSRLTQRFPYIDLAIGARRAESYAELIAAELEKKLPPDTTHPATAEPAKAVSFLTIMRGCACACTYCVVPSVRGPELCRRPEDILSNARARIRSGARELTLLGQRVNAYSGIHEGRRIDFSDLLRLLDGLPGLRRLRFMSPHPALCNDRFASVVRDCGSVCPGLHLPIQSGCDRLLGLMRRGYTRADLLRTVARLQDAVSGMTLSTDIIVGFPSESEEDFMQTLSLLEELRPAAAFCFKFSAREGTPAASLLDDVPPRVKEERLARLNALVDRLTAEALQSQVGSSVEVLAETPHFGRTRTGFKVRWRTAVAPGNLITVCISAATRRTLLGDHNEPTA